jgi:uncharacterized protein HemX
MKYAKLWVLLVALIVGAGVVIYLGAQTKSETKTLTGCLQKGDEPNEYSISDASGKIYEMRSSEVKLSDDLGHKVTVTGRMKGEVDEDEKREAKHSKKENGYVQVRKLTMVSTSCQ